MKLKQVLEIQKILDKRKLPIDMYSNMEYYSESRDEWIDIMELDIVHAIRILRKFIRGDYNEQSTQ
jgi:hypothetical protein|tara:strand:- start:479 stop:676 length:198 start_codon:yes stop_codon:yes gene_type:complete